MALPLVIVGGIIGATFGNIIAHINRNREEYDKKIIRDKKLLDEQINDAKIAHEKTLREIKLKNEIELVAMKVLDLKVINEEKGYTLTNAENNFKKTVIKLTRKLNNDRIDKGKAAYGVSYDGKLYSVDNESISDDITITQRSLNGNKYLDDLESIDTDFSIIDASSISLDDDSILKLEDKYENLN